MLLTLRLKGREEGGEDMNSYWMTLRKTKDNGI
jgi:hypothetical protein